jgi:serine protease inhibitor
MSTQQLVLQKLSIPRFKIEYGAELKDLLIKIGIKAAFSKGEK